MSWIVSEWWETQVETYAWFKLRVSVEEGYEHQSKAKQEINESTKAKQSKAKQSKASKQSKRSIFETKDTC